MATNPDRDEFLEDEEQDELARRSIFSAGWFRALLVLTVLAIVVVVSLPYLLNWLEPTPTPPPAKTQAKSAAPAQPSTPAPTPPPASSPSPPAMVPAPPAPAPTPSTPPAPMPSAPTPSLPTPSAKVETPAPPPATAPPGKVETPKAPATPADRPLGTAPLPATPAPPGPVAKTGPAAKQVPAAKSAQTETPKATTAPKQGAPAEGGSPGNYFVQVGAFLEEKNAEALAKQIRSEAFPVQISQVTRGGGPAPAAPAKPPSGAQNQLFITGSTPDAVNAALKGKGTAQAVKGGVVVNPPFDLETAMSLSSSLKKDGFKVVIRRAAKGAPPKAGGGPTYHVVRVGGYADRAKAQQIRTELEAKGHPGFLSQGAAR